jgi:hypothetical protein
MREQSSRLSRVAGALWRHAVTTLRMQFRSPVGLIYTFVFPTLLLVAFWVTYRRAASPAHGQDPIAAASPAEAKTPPAAQADLQPGPPSQPERRPTRSGPEPTTGAATRPLPVGPPPAPTGSQRSWRDVTRDDIEINLVFTTLPPDHGVVTPINHDYRPHAEVECIRDALSKWPPLRTDDLVQRARNALLIPAVTDVLQSPLERDVPVVVFAFLTQDIAREPLTQTLYWIATHQADGDLLALEQLGGVCLDVPIPDDPDLIRDRIRLYATKLLGRLIGKLP